MKFFICGQALWEALGRTEAWPGISEPPRDVTGLAFRVHGSVVADMIPTQGAGTGHERLGEGIHITLRSWTASGHVSHSRRLSIGSVVHLRCRLRLRARPAIRCGRKHLEVGLYTSVACSRLRRPSEHLSHRRRSSILERDSCVPAQHRSVDHRTCSTSTVRGQANKAIISWRGSSDRMQGATDPAVAAGKRAAPPCPEGQGRDHPDFV